MADEEDRPPEATVDFVPAICFVPRGVAKEKPDKIVLTQEELARVIKDTKEQLETDDADDDDDDNNEIDENDTMEIDDNDEEAQVGNENLNYSEINWTKPIRIDYR